MNMCGFKTTSATSCSSSKRRIIDHRRQKSATGPLWTTIALTAFSVSSPCRTSTAAFILTENCKVPHLVSSSHLRTGQTLPLQASPNAVDGDFNDLLSTMGLTSAAPPVPENGSASSSSNVKTKKNKKNLHTQKEVRESIKGPTNKSKAPKSKRDKTSPKTKIDLKVQLDYARNGHGCIRKLIDPTLLKQIRNEVLREAKKQELTAWRQKVLVASNSKELASACKSIQDCQNELYKLGITASLPFLQFFNNWHTNPSIKKLAYDLGESAAKLMDVPTVRLYQDSLFWKRTGDGPTPWHVDARMGPFDTQHFVTFWIPLEPIPQGGSALQFCSKTHSDFALPYWNPMDDKNENEVISEWDRLEHRYPERLVDYMPMEVGDCTVHSGWTLHSSSGNEHGQKDRIALAITYVDGQAEIRENCLESGDNEDSWSYVNWIKDVPVRKPFQHRLVPIVWPSCRSSSADNEKKEKQFKKTPKSKS